MEQAFHQLFDFRSVQSELRLIDSQKLTSNILKMIQNVLIAYVGARLNTDPRKMTVSEQEQYLSSYFESLSPPFLKALQGNASGRAVQELTAEQLRSVHLLKATAKRVQTTPKKRKTDPLWNVLSGSQLIARYKAIRKVHNNQFQEVLKRLTLGCMFYDMCSYHLPCFSSGFL